MSLISDAVNMARFVPDSGSSIRRENQTLWMLNRNAKKGVSTREPIKLNRMDSIAERGKRAQGGNLGGCQPSPTSHGLFIQIGNPIRPSHGGVMKTEVWAKSAASIRFFLFAQSACASAIGSEPI